MLKKLEDIKKVNFDKISNEEEFKKALQMTDEEFKKLIQYSQDVSDENTSNNLIDERITIDVLNEDNENDTLSFDLVYNYDKENDIVKELNHVIVYF